MFRSHRACNGRPSEPDRTRPLAHKRPAGVEPAVCGQRERTGDFAVPAVVLDVRVVLAHFETHVVAAPGTSVETDRRLVQGHDVRSCQGQNERSGKRCVKQKAYSTICPGACRDLRRTRAMTDFDLRGRDAVQRTGTPIFTIVSPLTVEGRARMNSTTPLSGAFASTSGWPR